MRRLVPALLVLVPALALADAPRPPLIPCPPAGATQLERLTWDGWPISTLHETNLQQAPALQYYRDKLAARGFAVQESKDEQLPWSSGPHRMIYTGHAFFGRSATELVTVVVLSGAPPGVRVRTEWCRLAAPIDDAAMATLPDVTIGGFPGRRTLKHMCAGTLDQYVAERKGKPQRKSGVVAIGDRGRYSTRLKRIDLEVTGPIPRPRVSAGLGTGGCTPHESMSGEEVQATFLINDAGAVMGVTIAGSTDPAFSKCLNDYIVRQVYPRPPDPGTTTVVVRWRVGY